MSTKRFSRRLNQIENLFQQRLPKPAGASMPYEYVAQEYTWTLGKGPRPEPPDFSEFPSPVIPLWHEQVEMLRRHYPNEPDVVVHPEDANLWRRMKEAERRVDEEWERLHGPLLRELGEAYQAPVQRLLKESLHAIQHSGGRGANQQLIGLAVPDQGISLPPREPAVFRFVFQSFAGCLARLLFLSSTGLAAWILCCQHLQLLAGVGAEEVAGKLLGVDPQGEV